MKWKPTKAKAIISLIILIIMTLIGSWYISKYACIGALDTRPINIPVCSMWEKDAIIGSLFFFGISSAILVYIIWSLIQKKK